MLCIGINDMRMIRVTWVVSDAADLQSYQAVLRAHAVLATQHGGGRDL